MLDVLPLLVAIETPVLQEISASLAARLGVATCTIGQFAEQVDKPLALIYRDECLKLIDHAQTKKGGLIVDVDPRPGEQHSWPAPKKGDLAQAIGKKTRSVIDATAGWGQDGLSLFRMGYVVTMMERSSCMAELLADGLHRLAKRDWVQRRQLSIPTLLVGDAINMLSNLTEVPDCVYLDPMFPPKRKKSAKAKKAMTILHGLLGDDLDRNALFGAAIGSGAKRVVVKSPDYAEPLGGKPVVSFQGKLVRYDVYLQA